MSKQLPKDDAREMIVYCSISSDLLLHGKAVEADLMKVLGAAIMQESGDAKISVNRNYQDGSVAIVWDRAVE